MPRRSSTRRRKTRSDKGKSHRRRTSKRKTQRRKTSRRKTSRRKTSRRKTSKRKSSSKDKCYHIQYNPSGKKGDRKLISGIVGKDKLDALKEKLKKKHKRKSLYSYRVKCD